MSALLLTAPELKPERWQAHFRALAPDRDVRVWPAETGDPREVTYVCAWKPPAGLLATLPKLAVIFSLGAGVDHLLGDASLPHIPVVRIVDPDLTGRMVEYVLLHVLMVQRRQRLYDTQQRERVWRDRHDAAAHEVAVGVMGLGIMGTAAATALRSVGFRVAGWSRSRREVDGVETFHGAEGLDAFLARTEILVCLLPHTPATEGILNLSLLRKLRRDGVLQGAHVINAGRGRLQVDADILAALDEGALAGATLDVFPTEPLPAESPLWAHPRVTITPHNAAVSDPRAITAYVLDQIGRHERGLPLQNVVDRRAGY